LLLKLALAHRWASLLCWRAASPELLRQWKSFAFKLIYAGQFMAPIMEMLPKEKGGRHGQIGAVQEA